MNYIYIARRDKGWRNNTFKFAKTREENKRPATLMQL